MKSIILEMRVEIFKILSAAVSIGTIILLSHYLDENYLISYVVIQTLLVVFSSIADFGQNVTNQSIAIEDNEFESKKVSIFLYFLIFLIYIFVINQFFLNEISFLVMVFMPISIISSVYNLRWLTVKRRSGEVLDSIIFGELILSILRLFSVLIALIMGYYWFEFALLFFPIVVSIFLINVKPVRNLKLKMLIGFKGEKIDVVSYFLSVFVAIKNQILSLFLPFVDDSAKSFVIMSSRVYGAVLIIVSGLNSRIPYSMRLGLNNKNWGKLKIILVLILILFIFVVLLYPSYIEIISNIFNVSFLFEFKSERRLFFVIVMFGIVQSSMVLILQCVKKIKAAIFLDMIYMAMIVLSMILIR